jgi:peptidyl-prolyl cis-trans isomerase D
MLRSLRDGAKSGVLRYILFGFMGLAVAGLVLTDVGGFFRGGISNNIVAKGKNIEISTVQFDRTVRRILSRQGMAPQEAYQLGLINQILQGEVQTQIMTREAAKLGININDDIVKTQIAELATPLATNGRSKGEALKEILRSQGISENEFIQSIRQEMSTSLFSDALLGGAQKLSLNEATDLYQFQNEKRNFVGIVLNNKDAEAKEQPTEENLQKFYQANKSDFAIPEKRSMTIATLTKETLADQINITEEEIKAIYDENIDSYKKPEQRKIEQAVFTTQSDAQKVFNKTTEGQSLKDSTTAVAGEAAPYLGENIFEQNGLLEEISNPVFAASQGDIIEPVKTALGWHVLIVKEIIAPSTESYDSVKADIKDNIQQERLLEDLIETANTMDDQLAGGANLDEVAAEMGLSVTAIKDINQAGINGAGQDSLASYEGDKAQILEAAFDFDEGETAPVIELADGRFIALRVDNVTPLTYTPFDTVKAQLETRWMDQQQQLSNRARAEDAMKKLTDGSSLEDIANELKGATVTNFSNLARATTPQAPITLPALREIFDGKQGENLKLTVNKGFIIGTVGQSILPDIENASGEIETLREETAKTLPQEIFAQYINTMAAKYKIEINERALRAVYGTPVDG